MRLLLCSHHWLLFFWPAGRKRRERKKGLKVLEFGIFGDLKNVQCDRSFYTNFLAQRMMSYSSFFIIMIFLFRIVLFLHEICGAVQLARTPQPSQCKIRPTDGKLVCLPDVFFIGASKAGTSTVATILFQHPMIINPRNENKTARRQGQQSKDKESHYFDRSDGATHTNHHISNHINKNGGVLGITNCTLCVFSALLISLFISSQNEETIYHDQIGFDKFYNQSNRPLVMEYTPNYFVVESAAESIKKLMLNIDRLKFIVMLRDPVKRVESSWKFKKTFCRKCLNHIDQSIPSFQVSIERGMNQGKCITACYDDYIEMKKKS